MTTIIVKGRVNSATKKNLKNQRHFGTYGEHKYYYSGTFCPKKKKKILAYHQVFRVRTSKTLYETSKDFVNREPSPNSKKIFFDNRNYSDD